MRGNGPTTRSVEHAPHQRDHELLREVAQALELEESDLGLDHPELHQVAAGLGLLGAEGGAEAVDLAEGRDRRLEVELTRLRQEGLIPEVVGREERRRSLAGRRREDRRIDAHVVALVEEIVDALLDLAAHAQRRALPRRAQPQVTVLHEESRTVLLGRDREVLGQKIDPEVREADLHPRRRAPVRLDLAGERHRGLLRRPLEVGPGRLRNVRERGHRLHLAAAVAKLNERDLARRALPRHPATQGDRLADMSLEPTNRDRFLHKKG
jgi:hypothetical protein